MLKMNLLAATALRSVAAAGLICGGAAAAAAQEAPTEAQQTPATSEPTTEVEIESGTEVTSENAGDSDIVVTGSRIRRPNLDSPVPVTAIGGEEFFRTGQVSVGDVLNELPSLRSTFSQANSTRFLGTAGLNLLDLRGLGTERTLVLQNGRRHVGGDVLSTGVSVDTNTIPTDLIERVEVVTGGNSAVYGSDAIAGVVNFILKDDYQGFQVRGQGGVSKYGDAGAYFISGLAGTNFADGRGNIAVNAEYARQQQYFGSSRPWLARQDGFVVVDTDPAGSRNGSDGIPDRLFFRDIRSATLNNTGLVRFGGFNVATGVNSPLNCGLDALGQGFNCPFIFQPDGTLVPQTGLRVGIGPNGSFVGGNGEAFRSGEQLQLSPKLDRYNVNVLARFEVTPALVPFVEAKYSRTDTFGSGNSGPAFITGTTLGDTRETFRFDNPFLSAQARSVLTAQRLANGQTAPTAATRFSLRSNLLGLGVRNEQAQRETYRIVGGLRGEFNDDWNYEIAVNYGRLKERTTIGGNLDIQRFLLAADAAVNPANGQIQCRSTFDPAARVGYVDDGDRLARDIAACVPINLFGGQFTEAQRNYVLLDTVARGRASQLNAVGFVAGDTSQFLNLPGGPIGFVLGAEYREDNVFYDQDDEVEAGYTFYNSIPTFEAPKSKVKEAFAEVRLPILKDVPFFQELEVSGAARVSDYNLGTTGTVWAYNTSVVWAPVRDLRLRGNYARSVRAPNQLELFTPLGQNFAPGFVDPCATRNIATGSTTRAANCAAAGIPSNFDFVYSQSLELRSGGNPNLEAEKSDSFTLGAVFTPRFLPRFSFSIDYYDITVNDVITSPSAQQIVNACYDAADLNNQFCALFQRAGAGGAPTGEDPFQIIEGSLEQRGLNYAKLTARGIDFEVAYRGDLGDLAKFDTRLTYTHVLERSSFLNPADPDREDRILSELGDPQDSFTWNLDLSRGPVTFGYQARFIGKQLLNTYEDVFSLQGRDPENADYADRTWYPSRFYHDVRLSFDATKMFNFYVGVDNVTNTKPPLGLTGIGGGSAIFENRGRFFYAGAVAKF